MIQLEFVAGMAALAVTTAIVAIPILGLAPLLIVAGLLYLLVAAV